MGSLFKAPKPPPIPKPQPLPEFKPTPAPKPEPVIPIPDDVAQLSERKKKLAIQSKRSGRASTIFTDDDDGKLG